VSQHVVRIYALFTPQIKHNKPLAMKEETPGEKQKLCGKTFAQEVFSILHPWRKRMKFSIFREWATSPFKESVPRPHSLMIENGEERGVTTPTDKNDDFFLQQIATCHSHIG
jgi:hypothetical protein